MRQKINPAFRQTTMTLDVNSPKYDKAAAIMRRLAVAQHTGNANKIGRAVGNAVAEIVDEVDAELLAMVLHVASSTTYIALTGSATPA